MKSRRSRVRILVFSLLGLPALSLAGELPDSPGTLLLIRFDDSLSGVAGEAPASTQGVTFAQGLVGPAGHVGSPGYVHYSKTDNVLATAGTIEFWIRPDWNGNEFTTRAFFEVGDNFNDGTLLSIDGGNNLRFIQWGDDPETPTVEHNVEKGLAVSGAAWTAGNWYHVAATWNGASRTMTFYVNGQSVSSRLDGVSISDFSTAHLTVGAETHGGTSAEAAFDELRVSGRALTADEIEADFLAGITEIAPPSYRILRSESPGALAQVAESSLPWVDPESVLVPSSPARLFYRVEGVDRLVVGKEGDTLALYTAWPSLDSLANSDEWIVAHHDGIGLMQPRVLALNFSNDTSHEDALAIFERLTRALAESSRWQGAERSGAPAFLDYQIEKFVDLRDDPPLPTCDDNSTLYPRKPEGSPYNFEYSELYGETFAGYYGYPDPDDPGRFLTLGELVDRGTIHEVWFIANHGSCGAPLETIELKQYYDLALRKSGYGPAGNGHDYGVPWIGRSLRLTFINPHRGIGCAMENLGHGLEGYRNYDAISYLTRYLTEYAGFDLDERWGLPFSSFYAYGSEDNNSFPEPDRLLSHYQGTDRTVPGYVAIGGNVHFTPNGRSHYDLWNTEPVMSTIRDWRTGSGPGGEDLAGPFTGDEYDPYLQLAPDCMGPWLVYWRQHMPGLRNTARDDGDRPMKNWWPFLFY